MSLAHWLRLQPKQDHPSPAQAPRSGGSPYLVDGGVDISARSAEFGEVRVPAGARFALMGPDTLSKHLFCDWLLGFTTLEGSEVAFETENSHATAPGTRADQAVLLGRTPLLCGDTLQESLLYRTHGVRKQDLYALVDRLYGPGLRARTSAENPLLDDKGRPVSTQPLTAREHLEIAQINLLLQKRPLTVLDLSGDLFSAAYDSGFRFAPELLSSGKTLLVIVPPDRDAAWVEQVTGIKLTASKSFA